jgi:hypothetical protein
LPSASLLAALIALSGLSVSRAVGASQIEPEVRAPVNELSVVERELSDPDHPRRGLVLPMLDTMPLSSASPEARAGAERAIASADESAEPIPVPLPPGAMTGFIGLGGAALARWWWTRRQPRGATPGFRK